MNTDAEGITYIHDNLSKTDDDRMSIDQGPIGKGQPLVTAYCTILGHPLSVHI